ncbi:MAG TPA: hypothetical protein VIY27_03135 [Myxococcota bacterium]
MRAARTLSVYVTREVIPYTLAGLAGITMILVTRNPVRVLDEWIGAGIAFTSYATQTLCEFLASRSELPIVVAAWIPSAIFAGPAIWMPARARHAAS